MIYYLRIGFFIVVGLLFTVILSLKSQVGKDILLLDAPSDQASALNLVIGDTPLSQLTSPVWQLLQHTFDYINKKTLAVTIPSSERSDGVIKSFSPQLKKSMEAGGYKLGSPIAIRIFKVPSILELWIKKGNRYELFRTYAICRFSGRLGPKVKTGDYQAPEGFYDIYPSQLNPNSSYFLSFNLGYPNQYDKYHNRTGDALMVHGECASVGCYAMSNARISEIYTLMHAAFMNGQKAIQVQVYPFALTANNMKKVQSHKWYAFWVNLKEGYDLFEKTRQPLIVKVANGKYQFSDLK